MTLHHLRCNNGCKYQMASEWVCKHPNAIGCDGDGVGLTEYEKEHVKRMGCASHSSIILDNPELDGTDFAHPAFWRGEKYTVAGFKALLRRIKDGKTTKSGKFSDPELTELRDWIIDLRDKYQQEDKVEK